MRMLYYLLYSFWFLLSLLPLRVHYMLSDLVYIVVYRMIHYRQKVVRKNISESFPEKSPNELRAIERNFYHWFCDYLVESVKLLTISEKQMRRRLVFKGTDVVEQIVSEGQSCAVYLGHYCNWEWITSLPLWITPQAQCGQIYHPIENPQVDRLFLKLRQRFGAVCIPMAETLRRIIKYRQEGRPVVIGYISDQIPFWNNIHHWCQFMNHDTPVLTGTERVARQQGHAVFYMDVRRVRRGYYEAEFQLVSRNPKVLAEYELTDEYFRRLEQSIRRDPACYLWSHNRWKRTREAFNLRYNKTTGRVDITSRLEDLKQKEGQ